MTTEERYRMHLTHLKEEFPNKEILTISDARVYIGWGRDKTRKVIPFRKYGNSLGITLVDLARYLSSTGKSEKS